MSLEQSKATNYYDLIIVVENVDAIKVLTEQIECALAGLKPEYHVTHSGITHLERNKNRLRKSKKILFMLDVQHGTFQP